MLKHGLPGYTERVESERKERLETYLAAERQRGLAEIEKLVKVMESMGEDDGDDDGSSSGSAEESMARQSLGEDDKELLNALDAKLLEVAAGADELMHVTAPRTIKVAVDSGAGDHVAARALVGRRVVPSAGSRNGRYFVAANGDKIRNEGQATLMMTETSAGRTVSSTFQVADVTRALFSVSKMCDEGCEVHFTASEGVVTKNGVVIARFPRENGLYVAEMTILNDEQDDEAAPFTRQGAEEYAPGNRHRLTDP